MGYMRMTGLLRWKVRCWGMINAARVGNKDVPTLLDYTEIEHDDLLLQC